MSRTHSEESRFYPKYDTPEKLNDKVNEYFESLVDKHINEEGKLVEECDIPTISALVEFLGFSNRASMWDYEKKMSSEYSNIIKRAKNRIAVFYEKRLAGTTPTGAIFWLKNQGWKDTQDITTREEKSQDLSKLSDSELERYLELQKKIEPEEE